MCSIEAKLPLAGCYGDRRARSGVLRWWALLVLLLLAVSPGPVMAGWKAGESLPDLGAFELEGKLPSQFRGQVVLIDFWASWCAPCKASFPAMEGIHGQYGGRGLVVLAVNVDEQRADMEKFLKKTPVSFAVVRDARHKLVARADVATMPASFLVDRAGKIRFVHTGYRGNATRKQYEQEIEQLLIEPAEAKSP